MKNKTQWNDIKSHYEQLIAEGFDFIPQLSILPKILDSAYVESLFPALSHNTLNISGIKDFHKSFDYSSICTRYTGDEKFKIGYSPNLKQTHNISKHTCYFQEVWSYLESPFLKQKIETVLQQTQAVND